MWDFWKKHPTPEDLNGRNFTHFPLLPIEIRNMIWMWASYEPRNVTVASQRSCDINWTLGSYWETDKYEVDDLSSFTPPPVLLRTTKESRAEALEHYSLEFANNLTVAGNYGAILRYTAPGRIRINWDVDTLCLMNRSSLIDSLGEDLIPKNSFLEACQNNLLQFISFDISRYYADELIHFCELVPSVKKVTLFITHLGIQDDWDDGILYGDLGFAMISDSEVVDRAEARYPYLQGCTIYRDTLDRFTRRQDKIYVALNEIATEEDAAETPKKTKTGEVQVELKRLLSRR
jgi:hypothetical protein